MENLGEKENLRSLQLDRKESADDSRREETSVLGTSTTETISTEWTDEKHRLYLKSMETSFVNNFLGSQSGKFKVLRRGSWQKIIFEEKKPLLTKPMKKICDQGFLVNPWIQRFRSSKIQKIESSQIPIHDENEASSSDQAMDSRRDDNNKSKPSTTLSRQSHIDIEEVSDQNFVDEENENLKASKTVLSEKTIIAQEVEGTSNDQVVPFCKK